MPQSKSNATVTQITPARQVAMAEMRTAFLESKFVPPRMPRHFVHRTKLDQLLKDTSHYRVCCVIAPAGYGKSTLMSQQYASLAAAGIRTCWLSLTEADSEPARFVDGLISALRRASPHIGGYAVSQGGEKDAESLHAIIYSLCNQLHDEEAPIALFLDDVHMIQSSAVHDILNLLIVNSGPNIQFHLALRTQLPLHLAKLDLAGELRIIDSSLLSIARQDAGSLIQNVSGVRLSEHDVDTIYERTEGWVSGLQWAALALAGAPDVPTFVRNFYGSNHSIKNYLSEVLLNQMPCDLADFLIRSSIFEKFSAPLCRFALGEERAAAIIEDIQRRNLFLVSLDLQNEWFRYHHLFGEFLRARFELLYPGMADVYFQAASKWFLEKNLVGEAIRYLLKGHDFDSANNLIAQHAVELITTHQEQNWTVLQWIEQLPPDCLRKNPASILTRVYCDILAQRIREAEDGLNQVRAFLPELRSSGRNADAETLERNLTTSLCSVYLIAGQFRNVDTEAQRWLSLWGHKNIHRAAQVTTALGLSAMHQQSYDAARRHLSDARELFSKSGWRYGVFWVDTITSLTAMETGNFREADYILAETHAAASAEFGAAFYGSALFDIFRARVHYEKNKLDDAAALIERAYPFANSNALIDSSLWAYVIKSRLLRNRNNIKEAESVLKEGILRGERLGFEHLRLPLKAEYVQLLLSAGNFEQAVYEAKTMGITTDGIEFAIAPSSRFPDISVSVTSIRLEMAFNHTSRTRHKLGLLVSETTRQGRKDWTLRLLILRSILEQRSGKAEEALRTFSSALTIGDAGGYCRSFVDEGKAVGELLEKFLARRAPYSSTSSSASDDLLGHYAEHVRNAFLDRPAETAVRPKVPRKEDLPVSANADEPLSERQLQILRLADGGLSNREIAEQLFISEATVKWHLHHIYMKLGVKNRSGAAARLRKTPPEDE